MAPIESTKLKTQELTLALWAGTKSFCTRRCGYAQVVHVHPMGHDVECESVRDCSCTHGIGMRVCNVLHRTCGFARMCEMC